MQQVVYEHRARQNAKDWVVDNYDAHEQYDYESPLLVPFAGQDTSQLVALDFACGPGRMVRRMAKLVGQCDGVDISVSNISQAIEYCRDVSPRPRFFVNNGRELDRIPDQTYDLVYSTIALQHIPVHSIRMSLFAEMHRVLKPGGWLSVQMAYSHSNESLSTKCADSNFYHPFARWRDNDFEAKDTNGLHDVAIFEDDIDIVREDLNSLGFQRFTWKLASLPHDYHYDHWIFLYGQKSH